MSACNRYRNYNQIMITCNNYRNLQCRYNCPQSLQVNYKWLWYSTILLSWLQVIVISAINCGIGKCCNFLPNLLMIAASKFAWLRHSPVLKVQCGRAFKISAIVNECTVSYRSDDAMVANTERWRKKCKASTIHHCLVNCLHSQSRQKAESLGNINLP